MKRVLVLVLGFVCCRCAAAAPQITVEALFSGQAMVRIDGVRRLLKRRQPSPEGITLLSADSREAVLEVQGERRSYRLGTHVSTRFREPQLLTAKIRRDRSGAYTTVGSINGRTVDFLVDTGASAVALPATEARRLGIAYELEGRKILVNTANGTTPAYELMLDQVQVGDISLNQVRGFVIEAQGPGKVLLGMSFLNHVNMQNQGTVLLLQKKY